MDSRLANKVWCSIGVLCILLFVLSCKSFTSKSSPESRNDATSSRSIHWNIKDHGNPGPYTWDEGLQNLLVQIVRPLPSEGALYMSVGNFRETKSGVISDLSSLLELHLKSSMCEMEGIHVDEDQSLERAATEVLGTDALYVMSGLYHLEQDGFRINAVLTESPSGRIVSTGQVVIRKEDVPPKVLQLDVESDFSKSSGAGYEEEYQFAVDSILTGVSESSPFEVKIWSDKNVYQIGEKVTFYFSTSQDAYLTLIDAGTSGKLRILFPNNFQQNNFVVAGQVYTIPAQDTGFSIRVGGPPGVERIKAVATQMALSLNSKRKEVFHNFPRDGNGIQEIRGVAKQLDRQPWAQDYMEIYITGDGIDLPAPGHERKIKPKPHPPKPIDITGTTGCKPGQENLRSGDKHEMPLQKEEQR